jgi:hypothetical protein
MTVMKKINKIKNDQDLEKSRQNVIEAAEKKADLPTKKEWMHFLLRMKTSWAEQIDEVIKSRIGITRTTWILEAIQDKLKRTNHEQ